MVLHSIAVSLPADVLFYQEVNDARGFDAHFAPVADDSPG